MEKLEDLTNTNKIVYPAFLNAISVVCYHFHNVSFFFFSGFSLFQNFFFLTIKFSLGTQL